MSKSTVISSDEPDSLELLLQEAYALESDSAFGESIQLLNQIIGTAPDDSIVYAAVNGLVRNYIRMDDETGLIDNLNNIREQYPDNLAGISSYDHSVTIYTHKYDFDEALSRSEEVIAIYISQGSDEEAAWAILEQGLIYEYIANSGYGMGRIQSQSQLEVKAKEAYRRILTDYPDTEAAWFLRELSGEGYPYDITIPVPEEFALHHNYPNPFNPFTTIRFDIPEMSDVKLVIYDLLGREVVRLIDDRRVSGKYNTIWNGKDNKGNLFASGLYIYRLTTRSFESGKQFHQTRKMVLLR